MARRLPFMLASAGLGALAAGFAGAAQAGGCNTGCAPPAPAPCCSVPTTHQITVPGVSVTPPSVNITPPSLSVSGATSTATATATAITSGAATGSGVVYATGGGSGFYIDQGSTGVINALNVESGAPVGRVCVAHKAAYRSTAIQAVCLDDKSVPHPASQVTPDRELADGYEGEVYRCIAGARMQYTLAEWSGEGMTFDHGQTHVCGKGEALYRSHDGGLMCRPQAPARDCNERSLLRRYGAGIKVMKAASKEVCTEWRATGGQTTASATPIILDGGVGGVVH